MCIYAVWYPNATTVTDNSTNDTWPQNLFVDRNNTLYVGKGSPGNVLVQQEGIAPLTRVINTTFNDYAPIFVTINGDIYVSRNESNTHEVVKWTNNGNSSFTVMEVAGGCFALFVDVYDNIYCSMVDHHQVVKRSFNDDVNVTITVAGSGTNGSASDMLSSPRGIFVTSWFELYVADCGNNRIQRFGKGQSYGSAEKLNGGLSLNCPSAIVLDSVGNIFIADLGNNRIVMSGSNFGRCIAGCSNSNGSASDVLLRPSSLSFDRYGNLYVADTGNQRIQKIRLSTNYCSK